MVAALLWAAVLVPSWMRRREFRAAEQNALRLQRTLRVLAETAEVPTEVRVEATAREALAQERMLRSAQRAQEAERKAQLAEARAAQLRAEMRAQQMKRTQAALVRSAKLRRAWVRRIRSAFALLVLVAIIAAVVGVGTLIAGMGPALLLSGLGAFVLSSAVLVLLAPGRAKLVDIPAEHLSTATQSAPRTRVVSQAHDDNAELRAAEAHAAAQAAAAARIDRARALARARAERQQATLHNQANSMLLQAARDQVRVQELNAEDRRNAEARTAEVRTAEARTPAARGTSRQQQAQPSFSQMGVVGDTSEGMLDLDQVLRNRRIAG